MENAYNLYDIEALFKKYLVSGNISSISLKNYLSDIRHFIGWLTVEQHNKAFDKNVLGEYFTSTIFNNYLSSLKEDSIPIRSINRRLSTLRHFCTFCIFQGYITENPMKYISNISSSLTSLTQDQIKINKLNQPQQKPIYTNVKNNNSISQTIHFIGDYFIRYFIFTPVFFILIFSVGIYGIYQLSLKKTQKALALTLPASITRGKILSFQGKLTDTVGNPVLNKTDVIFNLYNTSSEGAPLYTGSCVGVNAIPPDDKGYVNVAIGSDCGMKEIPFSIFYENAYIYVGITVGTDPEMSPRQQITNVEYANNTNTLQGFSIGTNTTSIPYINDSGELLINTNTPSIRSTQNSANFTLSSAKSLTLQSSDLGDIILAATESGTIKFQTGEKVKVFIDNDGNVGIGTTLPTHGVNIANGDLNIDNGYGLKYDNSAPSGYFLRGDGTRFSPSTILASDLPLSIQGFTDVGSSIKLTNTSNKVGIGTTSPDAKLHISDSDIPAIGKSLMILDQYEKQNIIAASSSGAIKLALTYEGRLGLGMGNPSYQLHLSEDSAAKPTSNTWTVVSDRRLKEDITPFTDGLAILDQINPVNYVLNGKANTPKGATGIGVIAQDVKDIIPYTVSTFKVKLNPEDKEETTLYNFNSSALTFVTINAIKEIKTKINDLTNNIKKLTSGVFEKKVISPIVETSKIIATESAELANIKTNNIQPENNDLTINLNKGTLSQLIIQGLAGKTVTVIDSYGNINTQGDINAHSASLSGVLKTNQVITEDLTASIATISGSLIADSLQTNEASVSGTLSAREVIADNISNLENNSQNLSDEINKIQTSLADLKNKDILIPTSLDTSSMSAQLAQKPTFDELMVTGKTNLYDTSIANSIVIGNIYIQNDSMLSLAFELKFSALSQVNFFEGDFIVSKGGDLTTRGTLTAQKGIRTNTIQTINPSDDLSVILDSEENTNSKFKIQNSQGEVASIDASGSASFTNIVTHGITVDKYLEATQSGAVIAAAVNFDRNGIYAPAIEAHEKSAGVGILPSNSNEVIVYDNDLNNDSLIYITPTSSTYGKSLFVAEKNTCDSQTDEDNCKKYFKIAIDTASNSEIRFNWWIIN